MVHVSNVKLGFSPLSFGIQNCSASRGNSGGLRGVIEFQKAEFSLLENPFTSGMRAQEAVYAEKEKLLRTCPKCRFVLNAEVFTRHFVFKAFLCAAVFIRDTPERVLSSILFDVPTIKDGKRKNKWRRTTGAPAKRAAGWGAKALAHIIFLFGTVIKQSACHCCKVNRLTFKYTVVSEAPPPPTPEMHPNCSRKLINTSISAF